MLKALVDDAGASPTARAGVLGLAYFAAAELGHVLSVTTQEQVFATFWPPAGLLLAALVLSGRRQWPALAAAACFANLASNLLHGFSVPVSLGFCAAHGAEACLGAWLLRRYGGAPFTLTRINDVLALACWSALVSAMVGAAIGAGIVKAGFDGVSYWSAWQAWWIADAVGVLVVAPVVFTWAAERGALFHGVRPWRMVEGAAVFLGMIVAAAGVYGELLPPPLNAPIFVLPFLLWAGLRFGPPCAAAGVLAIALIGVWNTSQGRGPYVALTDVPSQRLLRAQVTLCVFSLSVLALVAAIAERKQAERQRIKLIGELELALNEIKTLRGLIPLCSWCKKIRNDQGFWQRLEDYLLAHTEAKFTHGVCPECLQKQLAESERMPGPEAEDGRK